jgi:hypothetical protein
MGEALAALDRRWRIACRVLFKRDIGPLWEYSDWLAKGTEPLIYRKSSISGKDVIYAIGEYSEGSKWVAMDEVDLWEKFEPLGINQIKDIESIVAAVRERVRYTGNVVLGNSGFVQNSSNISDSFYMHETGTFGNCKYIAYSTVGRLCEDCFGCNGIGESQFCAKSCETYRVKRCFEFWMGQNSSDCYYVHNLSSCSECMFCFNLKNKRHAIGNLELEPSKYYAIKERLVEQIADELESKKRVPSLVEMVGSLSVQKLQIKPMRRAKAEAAMAPIEESFAKTCKLLFGEMLPGKIDDYAGWLKRHVRKSEKNFSAASGEPIATWDYSNYFLLPRNRLLAQEEALELGRSQKISSAEAESLTLGSAGKTIGKIAFFSTEYAEGENANVIECPTSTQSANCYRASPIVYSKYCAYSFWPRSCEHIFGSDTIFDSEFCINCYHSVNLKRCFEMDSCRDCSGSYFCHNCENVHDSMFCFNVKNKRYAIGNAEVGREQFAKAKKMLQEFVLGCLKAKRDVELDIYNIGAKS